MCAHAHVQTCYMGSKDSSREGVPACLAEVSSLTKDDSWVGWVEEGKGGTLDNCNRITIKNDLKNLKK